MKTKDFFKKTHQRGMVLVGVVALLIFLGLFALIGMSLVTSSSGTHFNVIQGTQALAIAHAGAEWYLEQLQNDLDWTNEINQAKNFAEGNFTINVGLASATEVTFTSFGIIPAGLNNVAIQRIGTMTAWKLSPAFLFALYQGTNPGANLVLASNGANPTIVTGDAWSLGSVQINSPNQAQGGKFYVPSTQNVSGSGVYVKKWMAAPFLSMPALGAYYSNQIANFNALLDAGASAVNTTVSAGQTFTVNGTMVRNNFTTTGNNVTINGNGTLVVLQTISLHNAAGSLTITPSPGGGITFLANRNLTIGSAANNPAVNVASGCTFYSRALTGNAQRLQIHGSQTSLNGPLLIANRRIEIDSGADVLNDAVLFVNFPGSNANNYIDIVGNAGVTSVDGSLISVSRNNPSLRIRSGGAAKANVLVTGLVYAYGGAAASGYCNISDATIRGSVVCNRFSSNQIVNAAITYSPSDFPARPPQGFDGSVMKKPNSADPL